MVGVELCQVTVAEVEVVLVVVTEERVGGVMEGGVLAVPLLLPEPVPLLPGGREATVPSAQLPVQYW